MGQLDQWSLESQSPEARSSTATCSARDLREELMRSGWKRDGRDRDRGCRVPGCDRSRWRHVHHMTHWEDGGATDTPKLVNRQYDPGPGVRQER